MGREHEELVRSMIAELFSNNNILENILTIRKILNRIFSFASLFLLSFYPMRSCEKLQTSFSGKGRNMRRLATDPLDGFLGEVILGLLSGK